MPIRTTDFVKGRERKRGFLIANLVKIGENPFGFACVAKERKMKRAVLALSVFLALAVNGGTAWAQAEDNREASFMLPPTALAPVQKDSPASATALPNVSVPAMQASPADAPQPSEPAPPPAPEKFVPVDLGEPVSSKPLADVDPETAGLLSDAEGGLGAAMWKDTPRALVDKFLQAVSVPSASPALNDLARRLLLSTAALPEGPSAAPVNLTTLRVRKLIELGDVAEAWKLEQSIRVGGIDPGTLRTLAEAALVGPERAAVCDKIPSFMEADKEKTPDSTLAWQKALVVCKMLANDSNAVQLALDLLREQKAPEDAFMTLMTRNYMGRTKNLPRQLTPLAPLNLVVLRQLDLPLPPELYARPPAGVIPELLEAKAKDEKARLRLAENAAAKGILSAEQLGAFYKNLPVPPDLAGDAKSPYSRAILYQKATGQITPQEKMETVRAMADEAPPEMLAGSLGVLLAGMIEDLPVTADYNALAVSGAKLMAMAGNPEKAAAWVKLAQDVRGKLPDQDKAFIKNWPIFVLSGLIADGDYAKGLKEWLDQSLTAEKPEELPARREAASGIILVLAASGFAVPEEVWLRVIEPQPPSKRLSLAPLLAERLRFAAQAGRKGETVLLSLLAGGEMPAGEEMAGVIRALRQVGLEAESRALAREAAVQILTALP